MSGPVVSPSTRQWQEMKLGPNLSRELRWFRCDLHGMVTALEPFTHAMRQVGIAATALTEAFGHHIVGGSEQ